jgi:holo-[acyl-carrier protein] synthase
MNSSPCCGIDIVAISRIKRLLTEFPKKFRDYSFTAAEQSYCDGQQYPEQHYAARWAVKEAYLKAAQHSELSRDLSDIEVLLDGGPDLRIHEISDEKKHTDSEFVDVAASVSMAHEQKLDLAIGFVCLPDTISRLK